MDKQDAAPSAHEQPYDSSFKALLDDQTLAVLSFLFGERIEDAHELKEGLLKQDTIKPALRVDCAYMITHRHREGTKSYVGQVELYALIPAMKGASYEVLVQAIQEMQAYYTGQESRFGNHLLWFDAFLGRTKTVIQEDKRRIRKVMNDFRSLLDESPFVQERTAESREEGHREGLTEGREKGLTEGHEEGLAEGLQEAVLTAVEVRFPALIDLAQEKVRRIKQADMLRRLVKGMKAASNEEAARLLLDVLAA